MQKGTVHKEESKIKMKNSWTPERRAQRSLNAKNYWASIKQKLPGG